VDIYRNEQDGNQRVGENSFDFSCLGERKSLIASENLYRLLELVRQHAPHAAYDDSYKSSRQLLESVWPLEQQTRSCGWWRERPGKYGIATAIDISNEAQFLRYSRLRRYWQRNCSDRA